ncbi:MAG: lytic transglycosylase domain-containing protein [Bacteroidota bacterium]
MKQSSIPTLGCIFLFIFLLNACIPAQDASLHEGSPHSIQQVVNFPLPNQLTFAGEEVPLNDPDVAERLDRELMALCYYHASTLLVLKRSKRWKAFIQSNLKEANIPQDFFYLAVAESSLSNTAVSSARAVGMWQLMKDTSKELGLEVSTYVDQRRDPLLATQTAIRYLKRAHRSIENWTLVAASYNRGQGGIKNALKSQGVSSYYDLYLHEQTYRYIFKILAYKLILSSPGSYGFNLEMDRLYEPWEFQTVMVDQTIASLPEWGKQYGITYKQIKQYNPWITSIDYSLPVSEHTTYTIRIPLR